MEFLAEGKIVHDVGFHPSADENKVLQFWRDEYRPERAL